MSMFGQCGIIAIVEKRRDWLRKDEMRRAFLSVEERRSFWFEHIVQVIERCVANEVSVFSGGV